MKRGTLAALGLFVLLAAALFAPGLIGGRLFFPLHTDALLPWRADVAPAELAAHAARGNPEFSDKLWLLDPDSSLVAEAWRRGELPTWNRSIVAGAPLLGEALYGSLYPPNALLLWITPLERAWSWAVALHVVIAGLGAFLLAQRLGLARPVALLAGLLFAAGGPVVVQFHYHMRFFAVAWVPWLLVAVHAFSERPTLLRLCAIPPPIALVILSGFPQTGLYGIVGAALWGAGRLIARWRLASWKPLLAHGGAFALGGALAAAQILPVDDAIRHSLPRAHAAQQQITESGTRWMLAGYLVPGAFQDPRAPWSQSILSNPLWNALYCDVGSNAQGEREPAGIAARPSVMESTCYLGALGLVLALVALIGRPGRGATPLALGLLVALAIAWAYALGDPFVVKLVARVPRMDVGEVRRILATIGLLGALLAAAGARRLLEPGERGARRLALVLGGGFTLVLLALLLVLDRAGPDGFAAWLRERQLARYGAAMLQKYAALIEMPEFRRAEVHAFVIGKLASAAGWFAVATAALFAAHHLATAGRTRIALAVLLAAAAADLGAFHFRVNPFVPAHRFMADDPLLPPLAAATSGGRVHRFAPGFALGDDQIRELVLPPNLGARFGIEDVEGYIVMVPTRIARWLRALEPEDQPGQTLATVAVLPLHTPAGLRSPLLDGLAVKHVLTRHDLLAALRADGSTDDGGFELVAQRGESRVYLNREALPFALVLPEACFLPPAPADDAIGVAADAGTPDRAADDRPAARERYALHQGVLRALATRPELLRTRLFLECDPPERREAYLDDAIELPVRRNGEERLVPLRRLALRGAASAVVAIERAATRIVVRLDGGGGGFLLVDEGFDPGWTATIDGAPAAVVPADVAFRGVVLPPGAREVVLAYRPRCVALGLTISGAALATLLALLLFELRALVSGVRARRPGSPPPAAAPAG